MNDEHHLTISLTPEEAVVVMSGVAMFLADRTSVKVELDDKAIEFADWCLGCVDPEAFVAKIVALGEAACEEHGAGMPWNREGGL